jgi:hypothetical protein
MLFKVNFISLLFSNDSFIFKNSLYVVFFVFWSFIISVVKKDKKSFDGFDLDSELINSSVSSLKNF